MFSLAFGVVVILQANSALSEVVYACNGTTLNLSCPVPLSFIEIFDAKYGKSSSKIAESAGLYANKNCTLPNATEIVIELCSGRRFCSINTSDAVFQDCIKNYKYLEVNFTCVDRLGPGPEIFLCPPFEQRDCANCDWTCQGPADDSVNCSAPCGANECVCQLGYMRDTLSGKCVRNGYCSLPGCDTHEKYSLCNAGCQPTCSDSTAKKCTECLPGYVCEPPYLRDTTTRQCVLPGQCPAPP